MKKDNSMIASYQVDKHLLDTFIKGLSLGTYKYHQFYDTHDVLASNWFEIQNNFKFSKKPKRLPILFFDIEVDAEEGIFPDPPIAKWAVNAITTMNSITREITLFYIPPRDAKPRDWETEVVEFFNNTVAEHPEYEIDGIAFQFKKYKNDEKLLIDFWKHVRESAIIALSGFNSNLFDIPYLVNRSKNIFGRDYKKIISEFGDLRKFGEQYEIPDYSFIDLLHLYKPQSAGGMAFGKARESYKLDMIANIELKIGKLEHEESLVELYYKNPVKFFVYNIFDTVLLYLLNNKLKHIDTLKGLAQFANTPFTKALVGRSLLYQYDKLFQYWGDGKAVCCKLYNEEISKVT